MLFIRKEHQEVLRHKIKSRSQCSLWEKSYHWVNYTILYTTLCIVYLHKINEINPREIWFWIESRTSNVWGLRSRQTASNKWTVWFRSFLIHLTLKYQLNTLLSLVNGSPRTTAFIIEIPELSSHTAYLSRRAQRYSSSSSPLLQCMILHCIAYHTFSPLFSVICQHNSFPSYDGPLQKDSTITNSPPYVYITSRALLS